MPSHERPIEISGKDARRELYAHTVAVLATAAIVCGLVAALHSIVSPAIVGTVGLALLATVIYFSRRSQRLLDDHRRTFAQRHAAERADEQAAAVHEAAEQIAAITLEGATRYAARITSETSPAQAAVAPDPSESTSATAVPSGKKGGRRHAQRLAGRSSRKPLD